MISDDRLPEYKLLRLSSVGAVANPQEVEAMARELLALRKAREGWKLVPDCFRSLFNHAYGMTMGSDWNKGTASGHHRKGLCKAVHECQEFLRNIEEIR